VLFRSEEVIKNREINEFWTQEKKEKALNFLEGQKLSKSKNYYGQEYQALFLDDLMQFFADDIILNVMKAKRPLNIDHEGEYYLGVDVAGMGSDASTFEIIKKVNDTTLIHVEHITTKHTLTTQTTKKILQLNDQYDFKRIYVDDGGLGFGVFSQLLEEETTRRKVEPINNAKRALDRDENRKKKLLKEDLYNNLLRLMERREITLLDDNDIFQSLKSVQYEFEEGKFRIFGNDTHIAEGLTRAGWCAKEKSIKLWVDYI